MLVYVVYEGDACFCYAGDGLRVGECTLEVYIENLVHQCTLLV
jgi:hypothetical protein